MSAIDPEALDLPTLAWLAGASANEYLLQRLVEAGHPQVRTSHGYVFQHLLGGARAIGELAEQLGVSQQAASKSVLELEALGYVVRSEDPTDSRIRRVALSAQGRKVIERGRAARATLEAALLAEVGPRAMAGARRALSSLLQHTGGLEAVRGRHVKPPSGG